MGIKKTMKTKFFFCISLILYLNFNLHAQGNLPPRLIELAPDENYILRSGEGSVYDHAQLNQLISGQSSSNAFYTFVAFQESYALTYDTLSKYDIINISVNAGSSGIDNVVTLPDIPDSLDNGKIVVINTDSGSELSDTVIVQASGDSKLIQANCYDSSRTEQVDTFLVSYKQPLTVIYHTAYSDDYYRQSLGTSEGLTASILDTTVSTAYTVPISAYNEVTVRADVSGGDVTINLPAPSFSLSGKKVNVYHQGNSALDITLVQAVLGQYHFVDLIGTNTTEYAFLPAFPQSVAFTCAFSAPYGGYYWISSEIEPIIAEPVEYYYVNDETLDKQKLQYDYVVDSIGHILNRKFEINKYIQVTSTGATYLTSYDSTAQWIRDGRYEHWQDSTYNIDDPFNVDSLCIIPIQGGFALWYSPTNLYNVGELGLVKDTLGVDTSNFRKLTQRAIDYTYGRVYVPQGEYVLHKPVHLRKQTNIIGDPKAWVYIQSNEAQFKFVGEVPIFFEGFKFYNIDTLNTQWLLDFRMWNRLLEYNKDGISLGGDLRFRDQPYVIKNVDAYSVHSEGRLYTKGLKLTFQRPYTDTIAGNAINGTALYWGIVDNIHFYRMDTALYVQVDNDFLPCGDMTGEPGCDGLGYVRMVANGGGFTNLFLDYANNHIVLGPLANGNILTNLFLQGNVNANTDTVISVYSSRNVFNNVRIYDSVGAVLRDTAEFIANENELSVNKNGVSRYGNYIIKAGSIDFDSSTSLILHPSISLEWKKNVSAGAPDVYLGNDNITSNQFNFDVGDKALRINSTHWDMGLNSGRLNCFPTGINIGQNNSAWGVIYADEIRGKSTTNGVYTDRMIESPFGLNIRASTAGAVSNYLFFADTTIASIRRTPLNKFEFNAANGFEFNGDIAFSGDVDFLELDTLREANAVLRNFTAETANFTAEIGEEHLLDSSAGSFTVTIPLGVTSGTIAFSDITSSAATNNITIDFTTNGYTWNGQAANYTISQNAQYVEFKYIGSNNWRVKH